MRDFRQWLNQHKDECFANGKNREELKQSRFQDLYQATKKFIKDSNVDSLRLALKAYDSSDHDYDEAEYKAWIASIDRERREESRLNKELLAELDRLQAALGPASDNPNQATQWTAAYERLIAAIRSDMTLLLQRETTAWLARCSAIISDEAQIALFEELWFYCRDGADNGAVSSILATIANRCGPELRSREKNNAYTLQNGKRYTEGVHNSISSIKR